MKHYGAVRVWRCVIDRRVPRCTPILPDTHRLKWMNACCHWYTTSAHRLVHVTAVWLLRWEVSPSPRCVLSACMHLYTLPATYVHFPWLMCTTPGLCALPSTYCPANVEQRQSVGLGIEKSRVRNSLAPSVFPLGKEIDRHC